MGSIGKTISRSLLARGSRILGHPRFSSSPLLLLRLPKQPGVGANATEAADRMRALLNTIWETAPQTKVLLSAVTLINATLCANYSQVCVCVCVRASAACARARVCV